MRLARRSASVNAVAGVKKVPINCSEVGNSFFTVDKRIPSSRFVPAMKGSLANVPFAKIVEAGAGINPSGPSNVGWKANNSGALEMAALIPLNISVLFALRKHSKVSSEAAREVQDGTPETKFCQSIWRRDALYSDDDAGEPDSKIFVSVKINKYGNEVVSMVRTAARAKLSRGEFMNNIKVMIAPALSPNTVTFVSENN